MLILLIIKTKNSTIILITNPNLILTYHNSNLKMIKEDPETEAEVKAEIKNINLIKKTNTPNIEYLLFIYL